MSTILIRPATPDDAAAIGLVVVRSWQAAYKGQMPDQFLDALDVGERTEMWRRTIQAPGRHVFVAQAAGAPISGFSCLTPSRDADADPGTGEIVAIYVHPDRWRDGHGKALMSAALDQARALNYTAVTLWVLENNHRARAFYESFAFALDGARKDDDRWGDFVIREVRYRRELKSG